MPVFPSQSNLTTLSKEYPTVFLAGTIELGNSPDWQKNCETHLSDQFNVLNPRVGDWSDEWKPKAANVHFKNQVNWELDGLEACDVILMNLISGSKSPISLLEFGFMAKSGKLVVVCPHGFWRNGNIEVMSERYNIPIFAELEEAINYLKDNY